MNLDKFILCTESIIFFAYCGVLLKKRTKHHALLMIPCIVLINFVVFYIDLKCFDYKMYLSLCLDTLMVALYFKGKLVKKLFSVITFYSTMLISQASFIFLLSSCFEIETHELIHNTTKSLGVFTLSSCVVIITLIVLSRYLNKSYIKIPAKAYAKLLILPLISIFAVWHLFPFKSLSILPIESRKLYILCFLLLAFNLFTFTNYKQLEDLISEKYLKESAEDYIQIQKKYYADKIKDSEKMKAFMHDYKKTTRILLSLLKSGRHVEALEYAAELLDKIGLVGSEKYTDNIIIDAVISSKIYEINNAGIELNVFGILPSELNISSLDLSLIISNALENSVEACINGKIEKSKIDMSFAYVDNHFIFRISNPTELNSQDDIIYGLGFAIMEELANKYNGMVLKKLKNNVFQLLVLLDI